MANRISRYFSGYQFDVSRRILIIRAILRYAEEQGHSQVEELARWALDEDTQVHQLHRQWRRNRNVNEGVRTEALELDRRADRALSGIANAALNFQRNAPPDHPLHKLATAFLKEFFPDGVGAITNQPYERQLADMREYVELWKSPDWSDAIAQFNAQLFVETTESLLPSYEEALVSPKRREITHDQLVAADASGRDRLASVIGLILGLFGQDDPTNNIIRQEYLATYDDQTARLSQYHSRRSPIPPVDIDTGEELDTPETPVLVEA